MDTLLWWFDLDGRAGPIGPAGAPSMSVEHQLFLYAVVVAGVLLAESVAMARRGGVVSVRLSRRWVATACLIALVVFPAVWREIDTMAESALLVQMGLAAQGGTFWGVLIAGAEKQLAP